MATWNISEQEKQPVLLHSGGERSEVASASRTASSIFAPSSVELWKSSAFPLASELDVILDEQVPDLVILGLSGDGVEAGDILETLAAREFDGKVLLVISENSIRLGIRVVRQNHRMIGADACCPALIRNVHR